MTTDLAHAPVDLSATLAFDEVNKERLKLIRTTVARNANDAEVAMFLELAKRYDLDPFAKEVWCAKSQGRDGREGQLLIMVGRDGLRKIAKRNGLRLDGDVVRKNDVFRVVRDAGRNRSVVHEYEGLSEEARGPIVGSWAEVYDAEGSQRGFFVAQMTEYRPTSDAKLRYSPWGSQESVMILAAAERQALRQATPLSGLLAEGEDARVGESAYDDAASPQSRQAINDFINALEAPETLKEELISAVHASNELAPNSWTLGKLQMTLLGRAPDQLAADLAAIEAENQAHRDRSARRDAEPEPVEAEVVPDEAEERALARRVQVMEQMADLEVQLPATEGLERDNLVSQLEALQDELDALPEPDAGVGPEPA